LIAKLSGYVLIWLDVQFAGEDTATLHQIAFTLRDKFGQEYASLHAFRDTLRIQSLCSAG
jgi:hypothetical protein